jgi:hypothetical protein
MHLPTMDTHLLYQLGCDPFRVDQGFIRSHIEMQVPLMDPAESPQVSPKRGAGPGTTSALASGSGSPRRGMFGIHVNIGHKNVAKDFGLGKTTGCTVAQVCVRS